MGLFSDMDKMGLSDFKDSDILKQEETVKRNNKEVKPAVKRELTEKDYLLLRDYECPVCEWKFKALSVKAGKVRQTGHDIDMRIHYEGIDPVKYEVISCPCCGYSAIASQFNKLISIQKDLIKQQISTYYMPDDDWDDDEDVYDYKMAVTKLKLALVCAMVKRGKASELAFLSLKLHWLIESYMEELDKESEEYKKCVEDDNECMRNAYDGFKKAFSSENLPIYGLDENTMPYIISALGYELGEYEGAKSMIGRVITSRTANERIKELARDLKDMIDEKI